MASLHTSERDRLAMHSPVVTSTGRDLRLDLFRGLALWLIFLDHIPSNVVSWITIRNYGFSDATEIFIFISGYTAAFVYGRAMSERGFVVAGARILKRAWQIYVAHIFLFAIYLAEISYVATSFENPLYAEEMNILDFLKQPDQTIVQALLLKFKPANMDVLPLYIVLLLLFPPILWLLQRVPTVALGASATMYVLAWWLNINLSAYPEGVWYFNPFAWQLLFVFGAWCALGGAERLGSALRSPYTTGLALAYITFGVVIALTWYVPGFNRLPVWFEDMIYPIDKTNLDVLRSLALCPAILCGQHSLEIFCLGIFLAFAGHFAMVEVSAAIWMQILISALGIIIMTGTAALIMWYKTLEGRGATTRPKTANADLAGGEA